jgi:hypothetical protein
MKRLDKTFNNLNIPFFSYTEHIVHTTHLVTHYYARLCYSPLHIMTNAATMGDMSLLFNEN